MHIFIPNQAIRVAKLFKFSFIFLNTWMLRSRDLGFELELVFLTFEEPIICVSSTCTPNLYKNGSTETVEIPTFICNECQIFRLFTQESICSVIHNACFE